MVGVNVPPNLMAAFEFDEADLEANQSGQLTEKQRQAIQPNALWRISDRMADKVAAISTIVGGILRIILNLIALLEIAVLVVLSVLTLWIVKEPQKWICLSVVLLAIASVIVWLTSRSGRRGVPRRMRKVSTIEGIIKLQPGTYNKPHLLRLNRQRFAISENEFNVLKSGHAYRLYYVGKIIVSLEPSYRSKERE